MNWYFILLIFFAYMLGEYIIGFFFNYKLVMISVGKFNIAAIAGAIATVLFTTLIALAGYLSAINDAWYLILLSAIAMGIGNFLSCLTVPKISRFFGHLDKNKKEAVLKNREEEL